MGWNSQATVRHYQLLGENVSAGEWLARWSPNKCREFNRIYKPKINHQETWLLGERLDSLLCFPALWTSWHMGTHLWSNKSKVSGGKNYGCQRSFPILYPRYSLRGIRSPVTTRIYSTFELLKDYRDGILSCPWLTADIFKSHSNMMRCSDMWMIYIFEQRC